MNTELFRKIDAIIKLTPEKMEMCSWASNEERSCGTTRCVAGWAVHLTTGQPLFDDDNEHPSVRELADSLGVPPAFEVLGGELLDLSPEVAARLFYVSNEDAAKFVSLAARGLDEGAEEFLDGVEL